MKICLINNLYKPFARGGAETAISEYIKLLEAADHKIFIITTLPWGRPRPAADTKTYYLGGLSSVYYHLRHVPIFFRFIWHICNLFNFAGYLTITKILKQEKPDLLLLFLFK